MKSAILLGLGACIRLTAAQSPTTWTTVTLYSTTTEYVNSTSTMTLYSSSIVPATAVPSSTTDALSTSYPVSSTSSTALVSTSSSSSISTTATSASTESVPESVSTTLISQTRARASATAPFGVSVGILSSLSSTIQSSTTEVVTSSTSQSPSSLSPSSMPFAPPSSALSLLSSSASSSTSTIPLATSTAFTLDAVRVNTSNVYEPIVAHDLRFYIGLNTTETCASGASSNCTTSTTSFTSGNGTISMTNRASAPQTVYIGPVGGLRYTALGQPNGMQNGSTTTGFALKGSGVNSFQISNSNGAFYACPRPNLGLDVAQIFVGIAKIAREDCWQVNTFGTVVGGV